jgi:hypothetical protein
MPNRIGNQIEMLSRGNPKNMLLFLRFRYHAI